MHMKQIMPKLIIAIAISSALLSCKKDSTTAANNSSPYWKGWVNTSVWEHAVVLRSNGTARYLFTYTGASFSDTASTDIGKYEGTYSQTATDSIYINCADPSNTVMFRLRGRISGNSISGTWVNEYGGITNTLPFNLSK